jgi:hypothetical protein
MWAAYLRSMEELGRDDDKGGPMKWEAQVVRHENGPRPYVVVCFLLPLSL